MVRCESHFSLLAKRRQKSISTHQMNKKVHQFAPLTLVVVQFGYHPLAIRSLPYKSRNNKHSTRFNWRICCTHAPVSVYSHTTITLQCYHTLQENVSHCHIGSKYLSNCARYRSCATGRCIHANLYKWTPWEEYPRINPAL